MIRDFFHVGISVKNLEESIKFYTEVMGMQVEYRASNRGEKVSRAVGIENAELEVCGVKNDYMRLELIDYKNEEAKKNSRYKRQDEPGIIHIAFVYDDVGKMYEKIKALGYEFNASPMVTRERGHKIAYFKGPDNVMIEICEK